LMAIPNLIGLLALSPVIYRETRGFFSESGGGEEPVQVKPEE
jgi:Na+/alanine symporter